MSQPPAAAKSVVSLVSVAGPRRLKQMRPVDVAALIERDPRLIVPIGTCEQHGPHLPLGSDTMIVERL